MWRLALAFAAQVSVASPQISAPAETLFVDTSGSGETVVLLPGLFGSGYAFRKVVPLLNDAGYRTIIIEPLGMGSSSRPQNADFSLTAQADRIAAVLDTLDAHDVLLVAHSVGASIAFRIAYRHPTLPRALLSLEGGAAESATSRGFRTALRLEPIVRLLGRRMLIEFVRRRMIRASADSAWIDDEVIAHYLAGSLTDYGTTIRSYKAMAAAVEPESLREHLPEVRVPVLLLLGGTPHRSAPRRSALKLLGDLLPSLTIDTVPNAGHFIHEENPQAVVAAIERVRAMADNRQGEQRRSP